MSSILLVDDEKYVLDDLLELIDWKSIGINQVLVAYNIQDAKNIIEKNSIQILLSDIEMP